MDSTMHTPGPLDYFVGNANGRGLIRIETSHLAPVAGIHIASMPRGKQSEADAAELVKRWNCHAELVEALTSILYEDSDKSEQARLTDRVKAAAALSRATAE